MILVLTVEFLIIALIMVRFVYPRSAYWARDFVVTGQVNKQILAAREGGAPLHRGTFSVMLEKTLYRHAAGSSPEAMKVRCLRIRELLGMMSTRSGERETSRSADVGGTIIELADMVHHLGLRLPAGLDDGTAVVSAEDILARVVTQLLGVPPFADSAGLEDWLENNRLSVEQIGELLIAAVYALACREELAARPSRGVNSLTFSSHPPLAAPVINAPRLRDTPVNVPVSPPSPASGPPQMTAVAQVGGQQAIAVAVPSALWGRNVPQTASSRLSVPRAILDAYRDGKLALFVGSGLSLGQDVKGGYPSWGDLPKRLLAACGHFDGMDANTLQSELERFEARMSLEVRLAELGTLQQKLGRRYRTALDDIFRPRDAAPGAVHRAILATDPRVILTTNYDQLLEMVDPPPRRQPYTWRQATDALADLQAGRRILFKIHGSPEDHESIVMSNVEYARVRADKSYLAVLSFLLQGYTFLFVGFGMNDPLDLDLALKDNAERFGSSAREHFVLLKDARDEDRDRIGRTYNVTVLRYDDHAEVPKFLGGLRATRTSR